MARATNESPTASSKAIALSQRGNEKDEEGEEDGERLRSKLRPCSVKLKYIGTKRLAGGSERVDRIEVEISQPIGRRGIEPRCTDNSTSTN